MLEIDNHSFEQFFNALHLYSWILDSHGRVIKANQAAKQLTGFSSENGSGVSLWSIPWQGLSSQNRRILKWAVNQVMLGIPVHKDIEINRRGQPGVIIRFSFKTIALSDGGPLFILAEGRDITEYKRTSAALNQSEARFKTIYEEAGIGILIKDITGKMLDCNPAFQLMLGYSAREIVKFNYLTITHPADRKLGRKLFNELVIGKRKSYTIEKRYLHKDGQPVWTRVTASLVIESDQQAQFVIAIIENITTHKEIENELSEMQRRLMQGREMERLRLAQDLHDGPLQELIDVTYQLKEIETFQPEDANLEQLMHVQASVRQLARSIRTICGELRPPTLVPFGLEKTIRSHVEQFQETPPEMAIKLDLEEDGQTLSEPIRIVLFRIYQAALNNILRHAQADQIKIQFKLKHGHAFLKIQDNGKGFLLPDRWIDLARQGHFGIVGARERAKEVGGDLEVITHPGKGTLLQAVVPFCEESNGFSGREDKI
jgi:PAS domain S-box-containing protein